ncbi:MAG: FtsX-like permease family protein [Flavipsychrobacter sp.]|nr:FtsX-like permease family protein [Flavipsychrobacter sp.]
MNGTLVWSLASRYLLGKRSANAAPLLSRISMAAIAVGSGAMIVLFSVFNGFDFLVKDLYKSFYPEIKITAARGKFFSLPVVQYDAVQHTAGVKYASSVIEDNVLANSDEEQIVATLKGIDSNYFKVNNIKQYIIAGSDSVATFPKATAIFGARLANQVGADVNNAFSTVMLYYPNTKLTSPTLDPSAAFQSVNLKPDGAFRIQDDFDSKYVLAAATVVQDLFQEPGKYSSVEIALDKGGDADDVKKQLQRTLGASYKVETRFEQNKTLYMVLRTEKWAVYAILLLVLFIASFNMVGALSMLVLEKQKDMAILKAMGASAASIRIVFQLEGMLWALTGGGIGILLGTLICLGQQYFKWIKLGGGFIIDAYPVLFQWNDFALVLVTIIVVGFLAAIYPSYKATRTENVGLRGA